MSLRLEMLQVARVGPKALGDSAELVARFLESQLSPAGAGLDRVGNQDLYYTIFVLSGLQATRSQVPKERVASYLRTFGTGEALDFVHLGALARCWGALGLEALPEGWSTEILNRLESFRTKDGGYADAPGGEAGNAYGCFVAFGAYQDLGCEVPYPLRMVQSLKFLEAPDGGWCNLRGMKTANVPATAAAITLLRHMDLPVNSAAAGWLLDQQHSKGGFKAVPAAPLPDLLSTATALHALAAMEVALPKPKVERCLDFLDTLWSAEGGFHGHWADDDLDAEYTFYGLLALGHLSI